MYPIIFLDIDGVLNCEEFYKRTRGGEAIIDKLKYPHNQFDPFRIELLNELTTLTGAKIVLSSSWRHGRKIEEMRQLFKELGIKGELLDYTPSLREWDGLRGNEILQWMKDNTFELFGLHHFNFKQYIIIDDDSDMLIWQKDHFFQTDPYSGLTPNLVYKIIRFLDITHNRKQDKL